MKLTIQIKLMPTIEQETIIKETLKNYIHMVNGLVAEFVILDKLENKTSADVKEMIPSVLKAQGIRDARSVFQKYRKELFMAQKRTTPDGQAKNVRVPILKKPVAIWNNQKFTVKDDSVAFPLWINGKTNKTSVKAIIPERHKALLENKKGTLRITKINGKLIAQIAVDVPCAISSGTSTMGIDLGLKVPAVAVTDTGKIQFFGNGRENKYMKRMARVKRKSLGMAKNLKALKKLNNKEQRWMKDKDHKISRQIVNFAKANNVSVIQLEELSGIRQTARTSRKNAKNLHTWSFYRLSQFI